MTGRRLARAAIQRGGAVERACGAARIGGAKEEIRWRSRAQLAEPAKCRLDIAGGDQGANRFTRGETGNDRLARADGLPDRCALAVGARGRQRARPLNQRLAFGGCRGGPGKSRLLTVDLNGTDAEDEQQSAEGFHPLAVSSS